MWRLGELCEDKNRKSVLLNYGKMFLKPSEYKTSACAKKMGGKKGLLLNSDELDKWSVISIEVQHMICKWKYANYEEVRNDLKKSENRILIHPAMRCSLEKLEKSCITIIDKKLTFCKIKFLSRIELKIISFLKNY